MLFECIERYLSGRGIKLFVRFGLDLCVPSPLAGEGQGEGEPISSERSEHFGYRGAISSSDAIVYADGTTGKQNGDAWMLQLDYTPWLNTRFALQYTDYQKLNGEKTEASDNNQLMLGVWFLF